MNIQRFDSKNGALFRLHDDDLNDDLIADFFRVILLRGIAKPDRKGLAVSS